jgi:hypothetical protein
VWSGPGDRFRRYWTPEHCPGIQPHGDREKPPISSLHWPCCSWGGLPPASDSGMLGSHPGQFICDYSWTKRHSPVPSPSVCRVSAIPSLVHIHSRIIREVGHVSLSGRSSTGRQYHPIATASSQNHKPSYNERSPSTKDPTRDLRFAKNATGIMVHSFSLSRTIMWHSTLTVLVTSQFGHTRRKPTVHSHASQLALSSAVHVQSTITTSGSVSVPHFKLATKL